MRALPICLAALLILTSCSSDDDGNGESPPDDEGSVLVEEAVRTIEGRWSITNEATDCATVFVMTADETLLIADGTFVSTSLRETARGTYALGLVDEGVTLNMNVQMDSSLANCDGESDENLDPINTFVRFPDRDTMEWYGRDPDSGEELVTLVFTRVASESGDLI